MSGVSSFYDSPIRLKPINKTAVSSFCGGKSERDKVKKKRKAASAKNLNKKLTKSAKGVRSALPPDGLILSGKASKYDFIPQSVIVKGVAVRLLVPGWTEAFLSIVAQLKQSLGDDLSWIESQYLDGDDHGYASKSSCLWKLRHLTRILKLEREDVVFVAARTGARGLSDCMRR